MEPGRSNSHTAAIDLVVNANGISTPPAWVRNREYLDERIDFIIDHQIVRDSSPGVPWKHLGNTNEQVLLAYRQEIIDTVKSRLSLIMKTPYLTVRSLTPQERVQKGFCDPIRIFVKQEMHSAKKVKAGRFRLIFSVSLVDQIVERLLYGKRNSFEIQHCDQIPSKPGMGLHDEGIRNLRDYVSTARSFYDEGGDDLDDWEIVGTDVECWDWTCPGSFFDQSAEYYIRAQDVEYDPEYAEYRNAIWNEHELKSLQVCCLSDGVMLVPLVRGIQKSGQYKTGASNSHGREILAVEMGSKWAMAMGDDDVEQVDKAVSNEELIARYANVGRRLKVETRCHRDSNSTFGFCSHTFTPTYAIPDKYEKSLSKLLLTKPANAEIAREMLSGVRFAQRHNPLLDYMNDLIALSGWESKYGVVDTKNNYGEATFQQEGDCLSSQS